MKINHFSSSNNLIGFNHLAGKKCNKQCDNAKCVTAELCFCWDVPAGTLPLSLSCQCWVWLSMGLFTPLVLLQCLEWGSGTKDKLLKAALR